MEQSMEEDRVSIDTSDDDGMVDVSGYFADDAAVTQNTHFGTKKGYPMFALNS